MEEIKSSMPRRADDSNVREDWEKYLLKRRVRQEDNGDDSMSLMQQRCISQIKTHSWKTAATMVGGAGVVVVAGMFAWGTSEHVAMRATSALVSHAHVDAALSRELETLRGRLLSRLDTIDLRIIQVADRIASLRARQDSGHTMDQTKNPR